MVLENYQHLETAIQARNLEALVAEKPDVLKALLGDAEALQAFAGVEGNVARVRSLVYSAWFWSTTNNERGETGLPQIVKDNVDWNPPVVRDPYVHTYSIN